MKVGYALMIFGILACLLVIYYMHRGGSYVKEYTPEQKAFLAMEYAPVDELIGAEMAEGDGRYGFVTGVDKDHKALIVTASHLKYVVPFPSIGDVYEHEGKKYVRYRALSIFILEAK